jgi:trans-aconitate 2-methyltransferase
MQGRISGFEHPMEGKRRAIFGSGRTGLSCLHQAGGCTMSWSAKQYTAFENERTRPPRDLLSAVPSTSVKRAVDLGCGPGNSTELLADRYPSAIVTGLDSSADMIMAARKRLPHLQFEVADLQDWHDSGPYDVILSNAVLQWVPDHAALLPRLVSKLAPGGSLAIQMPNNLEEPAHHAMRALAADGPWAGKLAKAAAARTATYHADSYYDLLQPHCTRVDVWQTTYYHVLAGGVDAVVEWFKGSGLLPFLAPLDAEEKAAFLARYRALVDEGYRTLPSGAVLLPFPRLFIVATR